MLSTEIHEQIGKLIQHIQNEKQRQQLQQVLWKYWKLFGLRKPSIIKATVHHAIETGNHPPIYTPPYRVSYKDEQVQRQEINKLLEQGIIEESTSPWSSPIVLVRKKDGSVRCCVDFRKLNNVTTRDAFQYRESMIYLTIYRMLNIIQLLTLNRVTFKSDLIQKIVQKLLFRQEINTINSQYYPKVLQTVHQHFNVSSVGHLDLHDDSTHWRTSMML